MAEDLHGICDQTNCSAMSDGRCLEGIEDIAACPHFHEEQLSQTPDQPETPDESGAGDEVRRVRTVEDLPTGDKLTVDTCQLVTHATRARVIIIAGREDSGKTTLLASIYEEFQSGQFAGYSFAGSRTLPGFERRCFLSRVSSGRETPDTERSKGAFGKTLLHLRVRRADNSEPIRDLLFTDLAGEDFRQAMNSTEFCQKLEIVHRADHFVLLIDGDKVSLPTQRQGALADGQMLLRRFLDSGMLGKNSRVDVLVTKYDRWRDQLAVEDFREFYERVETSFQDTFAARVARLRFRKIAARPENCTDLPTAYELDQIFPSWVEDFGAVDTPRRGEPIVHARREFDRYLWRRFRNRR